MSLRLLVAVSRQLYRTAHGRPHPHTSLPSHSVLPRVSPTLGAAEGHQRDGPSHPAWRVGRKVGKAPSAEKLRVGRLSQGGQWPMYSKMVSRLLCCALSSERGCGSTLVQQELVTAWECCVVASPWPWQSTVACHDSKAQQWYTAQ